MTKRQPQSFSDFSSIDANQPDVFQNEDDEMHEIEYGSKIYTARNFSWGKIFISAFASLIFMGIGIWVYQFITRLFLEYSFLGYIALILAIITILALLLLAIGEILSLKRLSNIENMRNNAAKAALDDDMHLAKTAVDALIDFTNNLPKTHSGRMAMQNHSHDIIDGKGLVHLAEYEILRPLDIEARKIILNAAKRVSIVTAISPRAFVDLGYVLYESAKLIRQLATLYGARPTKLGFLSLFRRVLAHLAITGSLALGDGLLQHVVGQGLATKISSRLGEGVVNGLLTTRIGIAAMDILRPFPFDGQKRPTIGDFTSELIGFNKQK